MAADARDAVERSPLGLRATDAHGRRERTGGHGVVMDDRWSRACW